MMKLACKDLDSSSGCSFEANGNTEEEVAGKMMSHIKTAHPDELKSVSPGDMMNMLKTKVHS